ncbi:hypothetical protein L249_0999 [Ophiocordyceps polyrhachis-furcata BCC 54312]|uniref:Uncharacterized protein n=1 Tax=Ophiocordyceps polyrhachis-furcata BCC 54312 TaxID=1330021 RepID=A0A367LF93_9HYPO|nr:hypothetical protein L249_0999 [Ophiocordyceps polyrhachis-furcata BCC 54312]
MVESFPYYLLCINTPVLTQLRMILQPRLCWVRWALHSFDGSQVFTTKDHAMEMKPYLLERPPRFRPMSPDAPVSYFGAFQ